MNETATRQTVPATSTRGTPWSIALPSAAISAAAYYASTGLGTLWQAAWVAPVGILLVAFGSSWRVAAFVSLAVYFVGGFGLIGYLGSVLPIAVVAVVLLFRAATFALAVLVARHAVRRVPSPMAAFAFPAGWTTVEFLVYLLSPHGTFLSLAYSQTDLIPLLQISSLTGIWGVTFVVTLLPSAVAVAWRCRKASALVPAVVVGLAAFGYGAWRIRQPLPSPSVRVGLAATDEGAGIAFATRDPVEALAVARGYAGRVTRMAAAGAQVIVLPEKLVGVTPEDAVAVLQVLADSARQAGVTVVAGLNRIAVTPRHNVAVVLAPDGRVAAEYEKHHLLPGPETGYARGSSSGLFPGPGGQWGVAICKDLDFPGWLRQYGKSHVRILAVPAWDFVRDARLHSRMAVVRGVENGLTIVRVAAQGLLTVSDGYGRILAEESSDTKPEALIVRGIAPGPGATFYTRAGDWFAWASLLTLVSVLVAPALLHKRRPRDRMTTIDRQPG